MGVAAVIDELDARLIELLTDEPRVGMLEASRRLAGEQPDKPRVQLIDHGCFSHAGRVCSSPA